MSLDPHPPCADADAPPGAAGAQDSAAAPEPAPAAPNARTEAGRNAGGPPDDADADERPQPGGDAEALAALWDALQRRPDFPALQAAARSVQTLTRSPSARVQGLVTAVLADPALTQRLLRTANTAHYRGGGGGAVADPARAIALLGFDAVQRMALSARLLDPLPRDDAGLALREDYLRALLAAELAHTLCHDPQLIALAPVVGMMQNLGRMVIALHRPQDALAIRAAVPRQRWPLQDEEQHVARQRLGMTQAGIGAHLARRWGWPDVLRQAMRREDWPLHLSPHTGERLRWLGRVANELSDLLVYQAPETWPQACTLLAAQGGSATGLDGRAMQGALAEVRTRLEELARHVGLPVAQLRTWQPQDVVHGSAQAVARPARTGQPAEGPGAPAGRPVPGPARPGRAAAPLAGQPPADAAGPPPAGTAPATLPRHAPMPLGLRIYLSDQALRLSDALLEPDAAAQVPPMALQVLWQALGARRAVLHLPPPGGGPGFRPAHTLGLPLPPALWQGWRVDPQGGRDLFSRLCAAGSDSLIDDSHDPLIAAHLPEPLRDGLQARRFLVLPVRGRQRPLGMIYLDRDDGAQPWTLDGDEMRLVRTVRNQVALALG